MPKLKKKLTPEQKRRRKTAKAERQKKYEWIFINGKQVRIKRHLPFEEEEAFLRSADPIWLHQNELWEYLDPGEDVMSPEKSEDEELPF